MRSENGTGTNTQPRLSSSDGRQPIRDRRNRKFFLHDALTCTAWKIINNLPILKRGHYNFYLDMASDKIYLDNRIMGVSTAAACRARSLLRHVSGESRELCASQASSHTLQQWRTPEPEQNPLCTNQSWSIQVLC
jgi:hypothetical protein